MIELIAARGNTSLESAVSLTKAIRWDIQSLGVKLAKAASDAELSRKKSSSKADYKLQQELEMKIIVSEMKLLLERIEDAVPLINLAITTSGVSLSTNLPATISPSRLLQASTFLSAGDAQYGQNSSNFAQIGPTFTLSMYMLFSGHARLLHEDEGFRATTWKEVIHKAQLKLLRVPLNRIQAFPLSGVDETGLMDDSRRCYATDNSNSQRIPSRGRGDEFAYQLSIIEDLDDDRVHTFEEGDAQPGRLNGVALAGLREVLPIHEISKIFYADTGKILNIGSDGETNNPVLLLKRDVHAAPPRRMMETAESEIPLYDEDDENDNDNDNDTRNDDDHYDTAEEVSEDDVEKTRNTVDDDSYLQAQFARETSTRPEVQIGKAAELDVWRLPSDLDPEWIAFEVYAEEFDSGSDGDSETEASEFNSPKTPDDRRRASPEHRLSAALGNLRLGSSPSAEDHFVASTRHKSVLPTNTASLSFAAAGPIRTSLSLLEMLIRLTSLQQFQQCSHLAITDELLNFFLEESSTTGAAPGDIDTRKQIRLEARQRVGFDPYDESPIKRRGEQNQTHPDQAYGQGHEDSISSASSVRYSSEQDSGPSTPLRQHNGLSRSRSGTPKTPASPGTAARREGVTATPPNTVKSRQAFLRDEKISQRKGSPLARSSDTSPGMANE